MDSNTKGLQATTGQFQEQFMYGINPYLITLFFVNYE